MTQYPVLARGLTGSQSFSTFQYDLVLYALVAVGLGLFASMIFALITRTEVSKKYRAASHSSALICGVATLGYLVLIGFWITGFDLQGDRWVPSADRYFSNGFRYTDWTITVPLLTLELLAVCAIAGNKVRSLRFTTMAAAFLMILTGFIGNELNEGATPNTAALLIWGAISSVFYVYLYVALYGAVSKSLPQLSARAGTSLRNAMILLFAVWGTYPVVYLIFAFTQDSTNWAITAQLAFCAADLTAKAGFGALIHKVAKLRTADDAEAGAETLPDIYPEEVYISHEKLSEPRCEPAMAGSTGAHAAGTSRNVTLPDSTDSARSSEGTASVQHLR